MIEFKLDVFHRVLSAIQHTQTMIKSKKSTYVTPEGGVTIQPISDQIFLNIMLERANEIMPLLNDLGADVTVKAVEDMAKGLRGPYPTYESLSDAYTDIQLTLNRELESATVLALSRAERNLWAPKVPIFGGDFDQKFRTRGAFELDEAAKCLALGRPTAGVFHMMRIMEVSIQAMTRCLGIPDPTRPAERNWGVILKAVKDGIDQKWPTAAVRMHGDGQLFEGLYASLDAVKNPWRNGTMHVDQKYTDAEAEDVFAAVRGFARKLAARMDEDGLPLA